MVNLIGPGVQSVRLIDVFVLGPAMVGLAVTARSAPLWLRLFVGGSGIATSIFNGYNWYKVQQRG